MKVVKQNGENEDFVVETDFYSIKNKLPENGQVALIRFSGNGDLWVGRFGTETVKNQKGEEVEVNGWHLFDGYVPTDGKVKDNYRVTHWATFSG